MDILSPTFKLVELMNFTSKATKGMKSVQIFDMHSKERQSTL